MTKVRFTFVDVQGNPLPLLEFKILLRRASFNIEDVGVILPEEMDVVTDASGQVIVELWPLKTAYRVRIAPEYEELCGKLNWAFYVPHSDEIIEAQTLFLEPPPSPVPWDEEAMGKITQAVQDTQDNKDAAAQSAADAKVSAEAADVDADAAALSASQAASSAGDALASKNAAKGSADTTAILTEQARVSAVNAGNSANSASQSATAAANSASNASTAGAAAGTAAANAVVANKQDKHVNLTAFSGLTGVADRLPYFTGAGALALATLTAKARELLAASTDTLMRDVLSAESTIPIQVATSQINLNTLVTKRTDYYINDGINTPVAANGYLTVIPLVGGTECHQTYRLIGGVHGIGTYARAMYGGTWSAWSKMLQAGDFGLGTALTVGVPSANSLRVTGFYYVSGSSDTPEGYGTLFHQGAGAGYGYQKFTSFAAPYKEYKRVLDNGAWKAWSPYVEGTVASSADDATVGRLLTVGYAGRNGGVAMVKGGGTVIGDLRGAMLYACNASYTDAPVWLNGLPCFVENDVHGVGASGYAVQRIWAITDPTRSAIRCLVAGVYTAWDLEKPLSQSNANGTYVMYPGGAMDAFLYVGDATFAASTNTTIGWTFPLPFVGAFPVISFSGAARLASAIVPATKQEYGQTLTSASCRVNSITGNIDNIRDVGWTARGRWK